MTRHLPRLSPRRLVAGAIALGSLGTLCAAFPSAVAAAEVPATGAPPNLNLSAPGVAWSGFVSPREPNYAIARLFNDYANPASGLGPVTDGPAHPYVNNEVAREMKTEPTYRVADLDNDAAKNLMP